MGQDFLGGQYSIFFADKNFRETSAILNVYGPNFETFTWTYCSSAKPFCAPNPEKISLFVRSDKEINYKTARTHFTVNLMFS